MDGWLSLTGFDGEPLLLHPVSGLVVARHRTLADICRITTAHGTYRDVRAEFAALALLLKAVIVPPGPALTDLPSGTAEDAALALRRIAEGPSLDIETTADGYAWARNLAREALAKAGLV